MKRIFQHPPKNEGGRRYWRTLEEYAGTPEFEEWLKREFPSGAAEMEVDGVSRRNFMRLMGASVALAGFGMAGCRRPESYITPFSKSVEWLIPGKALYYATAMPTRFGAMPLIATTVDGRPTKIEGNPLHPQSHGATDAYAQQAVLDLWDPDRSASFVRDGEVVDIEAFRAFLSEHLQGGDGEGVAILMDRAGSPTRNRLCELVRRKFPKATFAVYDPMEGEGRRKAVERAFGRGVRLRGDFSRADTVLSIGADFLGPEDGSYADVQAFSERRRVRSTKDEMNRLYVVEGRFSVTGGMADHRLRLKPSELTSFAVELADAVARETGDAALAALVARARPLTGRSAAGAEWVREAARDLAGAGGASLVVAGVRQPELLQTLVIGMNAALGAFGRTVQALPDEAVESVGMDGLARSIRSGEVQTLFILGGNPVYNAPADIGWSGLQQSVPTVVRLGMHEDETSAFANWHLPATHFLEEWDDGVADDGSYLAIQPMVLPLYGGISANDLLSLLATGEMPDGPAAVRATFDKRVPGANDAAWTRFLRNGFVAAEETGVQVPDIGAPRLDIGDVEAKPLPGLELAFMLDYKVGDGRYVNNGWAQECPDPVTKLTWDNALLLSPATAEELGVGSTDVLSDKKLRSADGGSDIVKLTVGGRSLEVPILIAPGHADGVATLAVGYGRERSGRVAEGVGVNAYQLLTTAAPLTAPAEIERTGRRRHVAVTHGHWTMEARDPFREAPVDHFREHPEFAQVMGMDGHIPPDISLYNSPQLDAPEQWAMTIDLNTCTGCNACVVACQAENNIPIVGREQVIHQREMHWIRIDRYFSTVTSADPDPEMVMQPLCCQHCENAPCETVCPVNATIHSEDGLNVMAYNRCIGTRYCANNCPYKVRRFNFFDYNKRDVLAESKIFPDGRSALYDGPIGKEGSPDSVKMQRNPNVTVRMRGVMEKCTFCVQRIEEAKIEARVRAGGSNNLKIPTDSVKSACQQACPAGAIVFGDQNDPDSEVAKLRASELGYTVLKYLNVRPRVTYLARLRNPNPRMPGADRVGMINGAIGHGNGGHGKSHAPGHAGPHEYGKAQDSGDGGAH